MTQTLAVPHPESNADLQEFAPLLRRDGVWILFQ
jgi:hypothetical protein